MCFDKKSKRVRSPDKNLTIDRSVSIFDRRREVAWHEFGRQDVAVAGTDLPSRPELLQNGLLEVIGQPISIVIRSGKSRDLSEERQGDQPP